MHKLFIALTLFIFSSFSSQAQFSKHIVRLKDKATNPFSISDPSAFLSNRAIQRRLRHNIPIDSLDLPVTPRYIDSIRSAGNVTILNTSKWLNQVAIETNDADALDKINSFPFVIATSPIAARISEQSLTDKFQVENSSSEIPAGNETDNSVNNYFDYGLSYNQVKIHNGQFLHDHGFRGNGMQMAILDAGFLNYLTLPTFDSVRNNNQILSTWDFVENEESVNEDNSHGMQCFSTIAANMPGTFVGTAPKSSYYLFRTEDVGSEYPIEEQNWAAGAERADSLGADVTSTSLGYFKFTNPLFDHTYADLDGNTTIIARAADFAAKKGMLVVAAAGNEGGNSWHYIITPADADSSLTVGAVDTSGNVAGFSSYGPSSDGQVKPDVASVGWNAVVASVATGQPVYSNGTSFACPNLAGVATCLWQAFPEVNNMRIIEALKASASKTNAPDDRVGYGVPDAKKAFVMLLKESFIQSLQNSGCENIISVHVKSDGSMPVTIERKLPGENEFTDVKNFTTSGNFEERDFTYSDDISVSPGGLILYRVRMDISADTSFYLDSASVNFSGTCIPVENQIRVAPNPVINNLNVTLWRTSEVKYSIVVHNMAGQQLFSTAGIQPTGTGLISIPMSAYSRGLYNVTVYFNNKKVLVKQILKG